MLQFVQSEGRICPEPGKWHDLWEMLPDKKRIGSGWQPPLPLILAAWDNTSGIEKMLRLRQHIQYAVEKGILNIDQYLRNLTQNDWHFVGK
ncbi:MAG: hypothetical protein A2V87_02935 [Deltaproteobacteria bacterium RBG_16_58_17]|nr:MAG: hypothetical protein A2V87_02935 [Deltaproteobacteria bacterium RBG_16_58_17]